MGMWRNQREGKRRAGFPAILGAAALLLSGCAEAARTAPETAASDIAPAARPAEQGKARPALWLVSDADTKIYLFGTIHVLKPGISWFDGAVRKAFDRSDTVVMEVVAPTPEESRALVEKLAVSATGPTLREKLNPELRAAYDAAMAKLGLPPETFDRVDPWFAAVTLSLVPVTRAGYQKASGVEQGIAAAAAEKGKPVIGLETVAEQLGLFDALSESAQLAFLEATIKELDAANLLLDRMVADWARGDPEALAVVVNDGMRDSPELAKVLLTDRNRHWADWIAARMATPGTVFVAVGAGHLAGEQDVTDFLAAKGLKVRRVAY